MLHQRVQAALRAFAAQARGGNALIAYHAQHFLAHIGFALHILTIIGHGDAQGIALALHGEAQLAQGCFHLLARDIHARAGGDAADGADDGLRRLQMLVVVVMAAYHVARVQQVHQLAGALQRGHDGLFGYAALKAAAGFSADAHAAGGNARDGAVEGGALKHHLTGAVGDFAFLAAHDAGQTRGAFRIADQQIGAGQGMILAVQRAQRFAILGGAYDDLAAAHLVQIKGVHGMAGFQHHIVGDIYNVIDGAHAGGVEHLPQPHGRGRDAHVFDHAGGVARAAGEILHRHLNMIGDIAAHILDRHLGQRQLGAQRGRGFARDAPGAQAVGAVGQNFKIGHIIVQAEDLAHIGAQGIILMENQQARVAHGGVQLHRHADFGAGAEHAAAFYAAQLALFDFVAAGQFGADQRHGHQNALAHVGRAANDLQRLALTHIHRAHVQMVAVFMIAAGQHPADHHVLAFLAQVFNAFHARAVHDHGAFVLGGRYGNIRVLADPVHRNFHVRFPPLAELAQEALVALIEQAHILDAVAQHGDALQADAKGKAGILVGIDAAHGQHLGVDHAAAQHLNPARALAHAAALAAAGDAGQIDLGARLGKGEEGGAEARFDIIAVQALEQRVQRALQIAHVHVLIDHQTLDLMENGAVGSVHLVGAEDAAGAGNADGGLAGQHGTRLHGGGVRAQHDVIIHIEGILRVARGMVLGQVQKLKVVVIQLDFGAFHHIKAQTRQGREHLVQHQRGGMRHAQARQVARLGHIQRFALQLALTFAGLERGQALVQHGADPFAPGVDHLPGGRTLLGAELAHGAQQRGQAALFAKHALAGLLQLLYIVQTLQLLLQLRTDGLDIFSDAHTYPPK